MVSKDEAEHTLIQNLQESGTLYGKFWFSKRQRRQLDKKGRDRLFFKRREDGRVIEYTEMVDAEALVEWPDDQCFYDDAVYLGDGHFHHRENPQ